MRFSISPVVVLLGSALSLSSVVNGFSSSPTFFKISTPSVSSPWIQGGPNPLIWESSKGQSPKVQSVRQRRGGNTDRGRERTLARNLWSVTSQRWRALQPLLVIGGYRQIYPREQGQTNNKGRPVELSFRARLGASSSCQGREPNRPAWNSRNSFALADTITSFSLGLCCRSAENIVQFDVELVRLSGGVLRVAKYVPRPQRLGTRLDRFETLFGCLSSIYRKLSDEIVFLLSDLSNQEW